MKIKSLLLVCLFAVAAFAARAGNLSGFLVNGPAFTNATVLVGVTNYQNGVITPAWTNTFNTWTAYAQGGYSISGTTAVITASSPSANGFIVTGGQVNTNLWPVRAVNMAVGYPNTLYGPANNVNLYYSGSLVATNATSTSLVFAWATSNDGTNVVVTHTDTIVVPILTKTFSYMTNFATGGAAWLMESSEINPGAAPATNIVIEAGAKPGI